MAFNAPPPTGPGEQPSAPQPGGSGGGQPAEPPSYPHQTLLPQQVQQSRSRTPLYIGLVVLLLLAVGGVVAWRILNNGDESTRAAYCRGLKHLTHNGDLQGALSNASLATLNSVLKLERLAPTAVRSDWKTLQSLATSAQSGNANYATALQALTALQSIADDAKSHCGIPMKIPGLP